jgi:hypothetical protein
MQGMNEIEPFCKKPPVRQDLTGASETIGNFNVFF